MDNCNEPDCAWSHLDALERSHERYADALIEIATDFQPMWDFNANGLEFQAGVCCAKCGEDIKDGCWDKCSGLIARRALGVA